MEQLTHPSIDVSTPQQEAEVGPLGAEPKTRPQTSRAPRNIIFASTLPPMADHLVVFCIRGGDIKAPSSLCRLESVLSLIRTSLTVGTRP